VVYKTDEGGRVKLKQGDNVTILLLDTGSETVFNVIASGNIGYKYLWLTARKATAPHVCEPEDEDDNGETGPYAYQNGYNAGEAHAYNDCNRRWEAKYEALEKELEATKR
jgi:hypothetical protein